MKQLNIAIIGCGAVAEIFHLPAIQRLPEYSLRYLIDINQDRVNEISRDFNLNDVNLGTDYNIVLEDEEIDEVLILTPPKFHKEILIKSAKAGKHIFCEKPFAMNYNEATDMIDTCNKNNVKLFVGFNFRFISPYYYLKQLLKKKLVGNIISVQMNFFANAFAWPSKTNFQKSHEEGGGALFEMGIHHIDLSNWYLGTPRSVNAIIKSHADRNIDDTASVFIKYENDSTASLNVAWSELSCNNISIYGYEGNLNSKMDSRDILYYRKKLISQKPIVLRSEYIRSPFIREHLTFYKEIINNESKSIIQKEEIINSIKIVEAAYKSSETSREIII